MTEPATRMIIPHRTVSREEWLEARIANTRAAIIHLAAPAKSTNNGCFGAATHTV
jgi:hypothetical protein